MCGSEPKPTSHYHLCLENHQISRSKLLKNACNLDQTLKNYDDYHLIHTLLYGSEKKGIIKLTVCYLRDTAVSLRVPFEISIFFYLLLLLLV